MASQRCHRDRARGGGTCCKPRCPHLSSQPQRGTPNTDKNNLHLNDSTKMNWENTALEPPQRQLWPPRSHDQLTHLCGAATPPGAPAGLLRPILPPPSGHSVVKTPRRGAQSTQWSGTRGTVRCSVAHPFRSFPLARRSMISYGCNSGCSTAPQAKCHPQSVLVFRPTGKSAP